MWKSSLSEDAVQPVAAGNPAAGKSCAVPTPDRKEAKEICLLANDAINLVSVAERCKSHAVTKSDLITVIADKLKFP